MTDIEAPMVRPANNAPHVVLDRDDASADTPRPTDGETPRPAPRPTVRPRPALRFADELETRGGTDARGAASALASGHRSAAEWWGAPGGRSSEVAPDTTSGHSATFHGRTGYGSTEVHGFDAETGLASHATAGLDRYGLGASAGVTGQGRAFGASAFLNNGYANVGLDTSFDLEDRIAWASQDAAALHTGAYLAGWKNFAGLGGSIALSAGGITASLGGYMAISADRSALYLGPYAGEVAELKGLHGIEVREDVQKSARVTGGVSYSGLGIGGRLQVSEGKEVVYRTMMEDDEVLTAVSDAADPSKFLRNKAEALGLRARSVPFPNLADPDSILVGDEMIVNTTGKVQGGILLGGLPGTVGVVGMMEGSFQIAVRKIDGTHIELSVCPKSVKSIGVMGSAHLFSASATKTVALAMRQAFVFDLAQESGRDAYRKAIHGTLPTNLKDLHAVHENDDARLLAAMNREELPKGVVRTFLEKAEVPMTVKGVSTGLSILPESAGIDGLAYHQICSRERQVITDGRTALTRNTRGEEVATEHFRSGKENHGVFATVRRLTKWNEDGSYTRDFNCLVLRAHFSDTKVIKSDINDNMVKPINAALGTTIDDFRYPGHKQSREVTIERRLCREDMDALAKARVVDVSRACANSGCDVGRLTNLIGDLSSEFNEWDRAQMIQSFVADTKLRGIGALHMLLGGNKHDLSVRTSSDAYVTPIKQAQNLSLQFRNRIETWDTKAVLNDRFTKVQESLEGVKSALRELEDDSFLIEFDPVGFEAQKQMLLNTRKTLKGLISLDHLTPVQRRRIYDKLETKNLLMKCDLLVDKYADPLQYSESKAEIKARFKEVEAALTQVHDALEDLKKDHVLTVADRASQAEHQNALLGAQSNLRSAISFSHLSAEERARVYDRISHREAGCFSFLRHKHSRTDLRIMGMLEALGTEFESDRPIGPQPDLPTAHPRRRHNMIFTTPRMI